MTEQNPSRDAAHRDSRGKARIGAIVPVSNTNLEPDLVMLRPSGVSLHFMRAGGYDLDQVPDSDQMRRFAAASLDGVLTALMASKPDVILYGCTSATLSQGPAYDAAFRERIEAATGVPAVTAAGALVEALADLDVRDIGFCSPYTQELNKEAADFLAATGINVVHREYVGEDLGNYGQGALTPEAVFQLGLRADHADARAVVLSCTDMRAVEVVGELEDRLGKPVVTSNQAMMHAAIKRLGLGDSVPGRLGRAGRSETRAAE
jgi:maleate isomerase/arylmalonate decarboxylase